MGPPVYYWLVSETIAPHSTHYFEYYNTIFIEHASFEQRMSINLKLHYMKKKILCKLPEQ